MVALSPNSIDMQLPLRLHFLFIVNMPIPFDISGVNSPLKLKVCPALIDCDSEKAFNFSHPLPSIPYSILFEKVIVRLSSRASIVK